MPVLCLCYVCVVCLISVLYLCCICVVSVLRLCHARISSVFRLCHACVVSMLCLCYACVVSEMWCALTSPCLCCVCNPCYVSVNTYTTRLGPRTVSVNSYATSRSSYAVVRSPCDLTDGASLSILVLRTVALLLMAQTVRGLIRQEMCTYEQNYCTHRGQLGT